MCAQSLGFEGLATQEELRAFFDSTRDRIELEGMRPGAPNMHALEPGPTTLYLVRGDGTEFEAKKYNDPTGQRTPLEVSEDGPAAATSGWYYVVEVDGTTGRMYGNVSEGDADVDDPMQDYPITSIMLAGLKQRMDTSLVDDHAAEALHGLEQMYGSFEQHATPEELLAMLELDDEITATVRGEPSSGRTGQEIFGDIRNLMLTVAERVTGKE